MSQNLPTSIPDPSISPAHGQQVRRCVIYARVSDPRDGRQSTERQFVECRERAALRGWTVVAEYEDHASGGTKKARPGLAAVEKLVAQHKVDVVLVQAFDRFARNTSHLISALSEMQARGIDFVAVNGDCDTSTPMGELIFTIFAAIGQFERELARERIKSGMRVALAKGIHVGRPRVSTVKVNRVRRALEASPQASLRDLQNATSLPRTTVARYRKQILAEVAS